MSITLRPVKLEDAYKVFKWKNDPLIRQMALDFNARTSVKDQQDDIEKAISSEHEDYRIIVRDNTIPIGYIRINWMNDQKTVAWLRFALGMDRGKGFAKPALKLFIDELFSKGCLRIEGEVYEVNQISQKVLEDIGFKKEGIKRKAHYTGEEYIDIYAYGLLKDDVK